MKSKIIIILTSLITMSCVLFLSNIVNADTAQWSQIGNTITGNYTSAECNFANSGSINIVLGLANGDICYWNGTGWTEIQPGSQVTSSGTNNGNSVTALYCDWAPVNSNISHYPDILAGYANGDVQYLNSTILKWDDIGIINSSNPQQVTKFGAVSIDSSSNFTSCNVETAMVPQGALTPLSYTNKQLWHTSGTGWICLLGSDSSNISTIDANSILSFCGLSDGKIQGGCEANVSSNPITTAVYLGSNSSDWGYSEFFYGDSGTPGNYGIGYFYATPSGVVFMPVTCLGNGGNNYTYTSVSPAVNGNQSVIVADSAVQLFNITNNYSTLYSTNPFWTAPNDVSFNGLYVDWNGTTPQTIIAGLTNGDVIGSFGNQSSFFTSVPPPNFPVDGTGCSQTFSSSSAYAGTLVEVFNNGNNCYIYLQNLNLNASPIFDFIAVNLALPSGVNLSDYVKNTLGNSNFTISGFPSNVTLNGNIVTCNDLENGEVIHGYYTVYVGNISLTEPITFRGYWFVGP